MEKLQAFLTTPVMGAPLWILLIVFAFPVVDALIKQAKWTSAQTFVEVAARFFLKIPAVGMILASVPLLGDIMRSVANDANLPPTMVMRVRAMKKPPAPPAAILLPFLFLSLLGGCAGLKAAGAAFGKCELNSLPQSVEKTIACGISVASNPQVIPNVQDEISACFAGLLPDQASCIAQAIEAWFTDVVPAHGQASPGAIIAIARMREWRKAHPTPAIVH